MFRGQFVHTIDAKGRVSVPARFRDGLLPGDCTEFILAPDPFDPCLHLYPLPAWEDQERKIAELPGLDEMVVLYRRLYLSAALDCELDKAGRMLIPPPLRERAGLEREAFFAGTGVRIELWSKERWQRATTVAPEDLGRFRQAAVERFRI